MKKIIVTFTDGKKHMLEGDFKSIRTNPITNCLVVRWVTNSKNIFPLENVQHIDIH